VEGQQFYRRRLADHLDANGDLAPPWEKFPTYERYTIGWRMGGGEDWLSYWHAFLETLPADFETRLAYLKRHPPAPINWSEWVYGVLHPSDEEDAPHDEEAVARHRVELEPYEVIASDIAYRTWLGQQQGIRWPWEYAESPEDAARYWTRDLWFWSRQVAELRGSAGWALPAVPGPWHPIREPLETRGVRSLDLKLGLRTLAQMLAAGRVVPPWELGLGTDSFADSFEMDMGYADAFRNWGMAAFDDREQMNRFLGDIPEGWMTWVAEHFFVE
jgi:hypothetical protein